MEPAPISLSHAAPAKPAVHLQMPVSLLQTPTPEHSSCWSWGVVVTAEPPRAAHADPEGHFSVPPQHRTAKPPPRQPCARGRPTRCHSRWCAGTRGNQGRVWATLHAPCRVAHTSACTLTNVQQRHPPPWARVAHLAANTCGVASTELPPVGHFPAPPQGSRPHPPVSPPPPRTSRAVRARPSREAVAGAVHRTLAVATAHIRTGGVGWGHAQRRRQHPNR